MGIVASFSSLSAVITMAMAVNAEEHPFLPGTMLLARMGGARRALWIASRNSQSFVDLFEDCTGFYRMIRKSRAL